jgi:hypothetical protein
MIDDTLKTRVLQAAAAEPSPTRPEVHRRNIVISLLAVATGVAAFVTFAALVSDGELVRRGGQLTPDRQVVRPVWLLVTTAGGALGVAAASLWLALGRGGSMLGRSRRWLLYGGLLVPITLFAWKLGWSMASADGTLAWSERPGLRCLSLSLLVAVGPLLSLLALRRRAVVHPALNGAAIGYAAGACAWLAVDLWCPVSYMPHVLLGHVLPLFILAALGAILGQALLAVGLDSK